MGGGQCPHDPTEVDAKLTMLPDSEAHTANMTPPTCLTIPPRTTDTLLDPAMMTMQRKKTLTRGKDLDRR